MKYTSMIPANDWFFVHENGAGGRTRFTVHHLAAWAMTAEGRTVGLLPVSDPKVENGTSAKLVEPPPIPGQYVHRDQLTKPMLEALASYLK